MEYSVIRRDLDKNQIKPPKLINEYTKKVINDVENFNESNLINFISKDLTEKAFEKFGMSYFHSSTHNGIFLSPRPNKETLKNYYLNSESRKFWNEKIMLETEEKRVKEIVMPNLHWVRDIMTQYYGKNSNIYEVLEANSVHELYLKNVDKVFDVNYTFYDPFFLLDKSKPTIHLSSSEYPEENKYDCCFLFDSIDRSSDPFDLINITFNSLKPGGICFITCLLSSGFEAQSLGKESNIFFPPEKMNLFSFEGIKKLICEFHNFEIIEFSTPSLLDIENVMLNLNMSESNRFIKYMLSDRDDWEIKQSFSDFLQHNRLGSFARIAIKKNP